MQFRNLTLFRFPTTLVFDALDASLAECELAPVGPLELSSRGFVSPFGRGESALSHRIGDTIWITIGGEDRILPSAVVNDQLQRKLAETEAKEGRKLGGRARRRLKEDLVHEMLPRAFVRPSRADAFLFLDLGLLAVDTASRKVGENLASEIRRALGSFPALPLNAEISVRAALTSWLSDTHRPAGFSLGDECELRDACSDGAVWAGKHDDLQGDAVRHQLESGRVCTRLGLEIDDRMAFTISDDLSIKKLRLFDAAFDEMASTDHDDQRAELDARFALFSGEIRRLFLKLESALKLTKAD